MDPDSDPDPAIFVIDQQKTNKIKKVFLLITFWMYIYIILKDKKSQNGRNRGFSSYFCFA
jgi:hypothetical protein